MFTEVRPTDYRQRVLATRDLEGHGTGVAGGSWLLRANRRALPLCPRNRGEAAMLDRNTRRVLAD